MATCVFLLCTYNSCSLCMLPKINIHVHGNYICPRTINPMQEAWAANEHIQLSRICFFFHFCCVFFVSRGFSSEYFFSVHKFLHALRPDFTSKLVHVLAFGIPKFYIAPYDKIKHELVNLSSNCDVKSGLRPEDTTF